MNIARYMMVFALRLLLGMLLASFMAWLIG